MSALIPAAPGTLFPTSEDHDNPAPLTAGPYRKPHRVWCLLSTRRLLPLDPSSADEFARRPVILAGPFEGLVLFDTTDARNFVNYVIMALRCPLNPDNIIWLEMPKPGELNTREDLDELWDNVFKKISVVAPRSSLILSRPSLKLQQSAAVHGLSLENDFNLPRKEWLHMEERRSKGTFKLRDIKTGKKLVVYKPRGVACTKTEELVDAYREMKALLGPDVGIVAKRTKPTSGTGVFLDATEEFVRGMTAAPDDVVVFEERLVPDRVPGSSEMKENAPCVHCIGTQVYGPVCSQLNDGQYFNGVVAPAVGLSAQQSKYCRSVCRSLMLQFGFKNTWGVDFLVVRGVPYLIDLNFGRLNNTHFAKIFLDLHDILDQPFRSFKRRVPDFPSGMTSLWALMISSDLAFFPNSGAGVAVLAFENGVRASFVATAKTSEEVANLQNGIDDLLRSALRSLKQQRPDDIRAPSAATKTQMQKMRDDPRYSKRDTEAEATGEPVAAVEED